MPASYNWRDMAIEKVKDEHLLAQHNLFSTVQICTYLRHVSKPSDESESTFQNRMIDETSDVLLKKLRREWHNWDIVFDEVQLSDWHDEMINAPIYNQSGELMTIQDVVIHLCINLVSQMYGNQINVKPYFAIGRFNQYVKGNMKLPAYIGYYYDLLIKVEHLLINTYNR